MLKRNHLFLSLYQFGVTPSGTEYVVHCPKCSHLTHATGFQKDTGVAGGKKTCIYYIECQGEKSYEDPSGQRRNRRCAIALCLPGEYAPPPTPSEFLEQFTKHLTSDLESRKERIRRAHQFGKTYDTRTREEIGQVRSAIERGVREWAPAHDIRGPKLKALRQNALRLMYYQVNDEMEMVEPELRTVGDVRRELGNRLPQLTASYMHLRMMLANHDATQHALITLTRDSGQQPIHADDNILD